MKFKINIHSLYIMNELCDLKWMNEWYDGLQWVFKYYENRHCLIKARYSKITVTSSLNHRMSVSKFDIILYQVFSLFSSILFLKIHNLVVPWSTRVTSMYEHKFNKQFFKTHCYGGASKFVQQLLDSARVSAFLVMPSRLLLCLVQHN